MAAALHFIRRKAVEQFPSLHHEHKGYRWWVLATVMIGTFMAVLDATIVNVALAKIIAAFGTSIDKAEFVLTAYLLVFGVMLPTSGWIADHFGYKRSFMLSLFLFTLGSFLCGLAWNEDILIFFRVIQGIGAGFIMPVGMAIVTREFPPEKRGLALGFWGIAAATSVTFGPSIGGYLIDNFSWHAIFNVNVPFGILGIVATWVIQREYKVEEARSFDFLGFVSLTMFLGCLLLALAEASADWNTGGWTSNFMLTCFALSSVGLVVFLVNEFTVKHTLIDLSLFKDMNFTFTNMVLFIFGMGMFGSTFLLPLYLQNCLGYSAFDAGKVFLPVGILQGIVAPLAGIISDKFNAKVPIIIGIALLAYSLYLNSFLSLSSESAQIMWPLYIRGFAMGFIFTTLSNVVLRNVPRTKTAQATGLFSVIRQIGGSFGVAVLGTMIISHGVVHSALYGQAVSQYGPAFQQTTTNLQHYIQHAAGSSSAMAVTQAKALISQHIGQQAFVQSIDDAFFYSGLIVALSLIPAFFLQGGKPKSVPKPPPPAE